MSSNEEQKITIASGEVEEEVDDEESEDGDIDDEEEEDDLIIAQPAEDDEEEDDDEDVNSASPSMSSSSEDNPNKVSSSNVVQQNPNDSTPITAAAFSSSIPVSVTSANGSTGQTTATAAGASPDHKRQRISLDVVLATPSAAASEEKKPPASDDSRRLFQRLWTDGDEIGLLQGYLEYMMQRGSHNSSHHHDTAPFYDQIKTRLHLDFNKNQLVEKLRRLKKKYRNVLNRINSGKDFSFKSPHDQATFEISRKIWSNSGSTIGVGGVEEAAFEDEEGNPNPTSNTTNSNENFQNNNNSNVDANKSADNKMSRSQKRSRKRAAEDPQLPNNHNQTTSSIPNVIEDTVRSCLSPLFKELLYCAISGPCSAGGYGGGGGGGGGLPLNPLAFNFGGNNSSNFSSGEVVDDKWRKQQILELEVYSKRIELVQEQVNSALKKLKSLDTT